MNKKILSLPLLLLIGCTTSQSQNASQDLFFAQLQRLCGKSFEGQLVRYSSADETWLKEKKIMHVRDCSAAEIKIPLHVGENRSRTWIISRHPAGLRLKHDHRHEDGQPETVTMYGGDTQDGGTAAVQAFPVDAETRELFLKNNLTAAIANVWILEIEGDKRFSYRLTRENRDFRIDFDLTKEVPTPPPVWGSKS